MKYCFIILLFSSVVFFASAPSSEIPKRRDFPLSTEISPCKDFYQYVCNPVVASFKLRDDRFFHDFAFHDSSERILESKKKYFQELSKKKNLMGRAKALSVVHSACMNEEASKKEEKNTVPALLRQVNAIKTTEEFQKFLGEQLYNGEEFSNIQFGTAPNQGDPSRNDVFFLSDMLTLPERTYYDKDEVVNDLVQLIKAFFDELHEPNSQGRAESVAGFEKDTAKTHLLPVELRDRFSMPTGITRDEFFKRWPHFRFQKLFADIPKETHFRNLSPENFDWINQSLEKVPLTVLKDAYLFRALPRYMDDAYPAFFAKMFEFSRKHLGGPEVRPKRDERCAKLVMGHLGMELDAELIPVLFPKFQSDKVTATAEKVRQSIISSIHESSWLSAKAKESAAEKIKAARLHLVRPKREIDWDFALPATYFPDKPYENSRTISRNVQKKELQKLKKTRNENEWAMSPLTINAYYSPSDNKFVLPIGILQYPFFDNSLSEEEAFGAMGSVIGHELGHGIDDKGAKFDTKGRLIQWMTDKDLEEFTARGNKIKKQLDDKDMPGGLKLGEFIGDLTGVSLSYRAAFPKGAGPVEKKKKFFTQYARVWCYVGRPKFMEMRAKTDPHAAGEVRTNDVLKHVDAFYETFQCKKGDDMYLPPEERVKIW